MWDIHSFWEPGPLRSGNVLRVLCHVMERFLRPPLRAAATPLVDRFQVPAIESPTCVMVGYLLPVSVFTCYYEGLRFHFSQ